ncbi:dipeptidase [Spirosoma sp. KNUC1025]|uniref:dipeptidase n=1 Tax=Spirosoma sp. KNUC1025 TaxID=2894082 RepID=UPI0038655AE8|nr:membrane dipeptidase [Spirosoma sp. KNUC1025]
MKIAPSEWSRRKFITTLTGAGTVFMLNPRMSWAIDEIDPRVAAIVAKTIGVDTHNHIDVPINASELPGPTVDLASEMKKSGLSAICMTFAVDYQRLVNPGDGNDRFMNGLAAMDNVLESNKLKRSLNLADLRAAHKKQEPTVIQSVEGGHFLEGQLDRLTVAYKRGLRHLGLLHDNDASVPLGDVYTKPPQFGGLTEFGANVIKECNKLGILIDLTHASNRTIDAALNVTTRPVLISHTGLDTQLGLNQVMAKMMRPRLISKGQAKIVANDGGVIGVWTHLADSPLEYAQNIRALVEVVGVDHVCIGTDTKLTPAYRSPNAGPRPGGSGSQSGSNNSQGGPPPNNNGQNGGGNNRPRVGERTNEAWHDQKVGFYYAVVDALLKTGFTEDEIAKIGGENFCRVFDAATAGH